MLAWFDFSGALVLFLAVVVGFLQPGCEFVIQVVGLVDAQKVNNAGVFFLGFLDPPMLKAPAQDENQIEPILGHSHACKDGSELEENPGLGWDNQDFTAAR